MASTPGAPDRGPLLAHPAPPRRKRTWLRVLLAVILIPLGLLLALAAVGFMIGSGPDRAPAPAPSSAGAGGPGEPPAAGEITGAGTLSAFDLRPGDCYNSRLAPPPAGGARPISTVDAVPCTQPHTGQVVAKFTYPATDPIGGMKDGVLTPDCAAAFQQKLDRSARSFPAGTIQPADQATWIRKPVVACVVFTDPPVSRSLVK